ncbi:MAG: hypothetical protein WDW36_009909 [Sanguina aurantia]
MQSAAALQHAFTSQAGGSAEPGMYPAFRIALAGSLGLLLGGFTYASFPFSTLHQEAVASPEALTVRQELALESKPPQAAPAAAGASSPALGALPRYSREEVSKHKTREAGVWVTYKDGVYDVTKWLDLHPGGAGKIMLAAGGAVDPFWAMYQQHQKAEVKAMLEEYKIGELEGDGGPAPVYSDPYAKEPPRHPALISRSSNPCNAETPPSLLTANAITPTDFFYVRNHLPVPTVDADAYRLRVEGEGLRTMDLTLEALKTKFKKHTITATIQCAGNRRDEMNKIKAVKGLEWDTGVIGTATWSGVWLRDVLAYAGLDEDVDSSVAAHIHFVGLDSDSTSGEVYGTSIPIDKALGRHGDVLLAYEMNGQPLSRDHGFPVRAVVPGTVGARNVKWLGKIISSPEESRSHWQQRDYKCFNPQVDWDTVDWASAPAIQEMPVTSAICEPAPNSVLSVHDDELTVRGYAWSGGGRGIARVDVSVDGGKTWAAAEMKAPNQVQNRVWAWTLWQATLPMPKGLGARDMVVTCKATDTAYNTQPDTVAAIWNLRGCNNNAWHSVPVSVAA